MNKWIAEFELEDGDTMPEHMDLEYNGVKLDFHCKPLEQELKTEWISSDNPPKRVKRVLVYYEVNRSIREVGIGCYFGDGWHVENVSEDGVQGKVLAWCELPKPYKTESESDI